MLATFVFYSSCKGVASRIFCGKRYGHCSVIIDDGKDYVMSWSNGGNFNHKILKASTLEGLIKTIKKSSKDVEAIITVKMKHKVKIKWFPLLVNSCNELCRKVSGVDIGPTFNVRNLHNSILAQDGETNYSVDYYWSKKNG